MRDLRARYVGSTLGLFWSIIHPLIILFLYILVFSTLVRGVATGAGGQVASYAVYLCPAILAWNWFNESLIIACTSMTGNATLIKKIVFPVAILPVTGILTGLVPFLAAIVVFLGFAACVKAFHPITLLYLPLVMILQGLLVIGPAYLLAALNVFVRDTAQFLTAALQFLFWGTPIVYMEETLTKPFPWLKFWFDLNPVAHLVAAYRDAIIWHRAPSVGSVIYLLIFSLLSYQAGRTLFIRGRGHFPDEV